MAGDDISGDRDETRAVLMLARGETVRDVAAECGCSERTLFRRLQSEKFAAEVATVRSTLISDLADEVGTMLRDAVGTLHHLAVNGSNESIKLKAAQELLAAGLRLRTCADTEQRIAQLERTIGR